MTVIDNAIYIDGKRAIVPKSLDQTFEELRTCTDTPGQFEAFRNAHVLSGTRDFDRVRPLNEWLQPTTEMQGTRGIRLFLMEGLAGTEVVTGACLLAAAKKA